LTFDAVGNLTSDGQRTYSWDAENRLVGIVYPGVSGKQTAFSYDGLGRRTAIASTPAGGGSTVTTSYLWCGSDSVLLLASRRSAKVLGVVGLGLSRLNMLNYCARRRNARADGTTGAKKNSTSPRRS